MTFSDFSFKKIADDKTYIRIENQPRQGEVLGSFSPPKMAHVARWLHAGEFWYMTRFPSSCISKRLVKAEVGLHMKNAVKLEGQGVAMETMRSRQAVPDRRVVGFVFRT